jgi:hypothetical protein
MIASATPRLRVEHACRRWGRDEVVRRCLALLAGEDDEPEFIAMLGGPPALQLLSAGVPQTQAYWVRVWAARGLLWAGVGDEVEPVRVALGDASWRVREMLCKVIARHALGDVLDDVAQLESDPVPRVRVAASRAVTTIIAADG